MSGLTVIIPFRSENSIELLEETLASVLEFRAEDVEILVVNAGGYSDCYSIEEEGVHFLPAEKTASLTECINLGLFAAKTPFIQTLLCGVTVHDGWADVPLEQFKNPAIGAVVPQIVRSNEGGDILESGWRYSRDGEILPLIRGEEQSAFVQNAPTQYSAFYRRRPLLDLGGFEADYPLDFAQIDASLFLTSLGFKTLLDASAPLMGADCPEEEPDQTAVWTYAEALFRRWLDWGGRQKNLRLYKRRAFADWFRNLFSGNAAAKKQAKENGRLLAKENEKKDKLYAAKQEMMLRLRNQ